MNYTESESLQLTTTLDYLTSHLWFVASGAKASTTSSRAGPDSIILVWTVGLVGPGQVVGLHDR